MRIFEVVALLRIVVSPQRVKGGDANASIIEAAVSASEWFGLTFSCLKVWQNARLNREPGLGAFAFGNKMFVVKCRNGAALD